MGAIKKVPLNRPYKTLGEQKSCKAFAGFIFVCNDATVPDPHLKIFGLPCQHAESVRAIREGMPLFLFNYSTRLLHGIFEAASDGGFNLDPHAWGHLDPSKVAGRYAGPVSKYPAQVRVRLKAASPPLDERAFRPVLHHFGGSNFKLELSFDQVQKLFHLFGAFGFSKDLLKDDSHTRLSLATLACQDPGTALSSFKSGSNGCSEYLSKCAKIESDCDLADDCPVQRAIPNHINYHLYCQACLGAGLVVPPLPGLQCNQPKSCCGFPTQSFHSSNQCQSNEFEATLTKEEKTDYIHRSKENEDKFLDYCNSPQIPVSLPHTFQSEPLALLAIHRMLQLYHNPVMAWLLAGSQGFPLALPVVTNAKSTNQLYEQLQADRLKNRCHASQPFVPSSIPATPLHFATSLLEELHFDILQFAKQTRPLGETVIHVEAAIECVRKAIKGLWPEADVEVFGSFATGLCLQHSDVDLVVVDAPMVVGSKNNSAQASVYLIKKLAAALKEYKWCESSHVIAYASVPVIKCLCRPFTSMRSTVIHVDVTIGDRKNEGGASQMKESSKGLQTGKFGIRHTGRAAREYVLNKIRELPALAPLALLLKSFLQHKGLSNVYSGGLGSFALILLITFYLERTPASSGLFSEGGFNGIPFRRESSRIHTACNSFNVSDELHRHEHEGLKSSNFYVRRAAAVVDRVLSVWGSNKSPCLGMLLLGFLHMFGIGLDLSLQKLVLKGIDGSSGGIFSRNNPHTALWIDDPLCPGVNIAAASYAMPQVQDAFRDMLQALIHHQMLAGPLQCSESPCRDLDTMHRLQHLSILQRG